MNPEKLRNIKFFYIFYKIYFFLNFIILLFYISYIIFFIVIFFIFFFYILYFKYILFYFFLDFFLFYNKFISHKILFIILWYSANHTKKNINWTIKKIKVSNHKKKKINRYLTNLRLLAETKRFSHLGQGWNWNLAERFRQLNQICRNL